MTLKSIQLFMCGALALMTAKSRAGDYEHNGGQSVSIGGNVQVRDLVDAEECTWTQGFEFNQNLKHLDRIISVIEERNWLLANEIRNYADRMLVCMSRKSLRPIPAEDQDGYPGVQMPGTAPGKYAQAAVRVGNTVYIDGVLFNQMDDINRAYLMLHEVMHGFVRYKSTLDKRIQDMRAVVRFIYEIDMQIQNPSVELFQQVLQQYHVYIPSESCAHPYEPEMGFNVFIRTTPRGLRAETVNNLNAASQKRFLKKALLECARRDLFDLAIAKGFMASDWNPMDVETLQLFLKYPTSGFSPKGLVESKVDQYLSQDDELTIPYLIQNKLDSEVNAENSWLLEKILLQLNDEMNSKDGRDFNPTLSRGLKLYDTLLKEGVTAKSVRQKTACELAIKTKTATYSGSNYYDAKLAIFQKLYSTVGFNKDIICSLDGAEIALPKLLKSLKKEWKKKASEGFLEYLENMITLLQSSETK